MGNALQIGDNTYPMSLEAMFYALENGTGATGIFTFDTALPNTEVLLMETGLAEIHGLMFLAEGFPSQYNVVNSTQTTGIGIVNFENGELKHSLCVNRNANTCKEYLKGVSSGDVIYGVTQGKIRIDAGNVYCTANFNQNANYTPFEPNIKYRWIAW